MKSTLSSVSYFFLLFLAIITLSATVVSAETNAHRMARGLTPLPPVNLKRKASHAQLAARSRPSQTPPHPPPICSVHGTRMLLCCDTLTGTSGKGCQMLADDDCRASKCKHQEVCCTSLTGSNAKDCVHI